MKNVSPNPFQSTKLPTVDIPRKARKFERIVVSGGIGGEIEMGETGREDEKEERRRKRGRSD